MGRGFETARRAAILFLPTALLAGAALYILFRVQDDAARAVAEASEARVVDQARSAVIAGLSGAAGDVRYFSRQPEAGAWLDGGDRSLREAIVSDYLAFAEAHPVYDQIRLLDLHGREKVRVDRRNGTPADVPEAGLQDKSARPFIAESLKLKAGQVDQSPFDLNVENGIVEKPAKPTIRFAAPVVDAAGLTRGIVVLNYLGQPLIDQIRTLNQGRVGVLSLLNGNGFWLAGPAAVDDWSFMFPDRPQRTFAASDPDAWQRIMSGDAAGSFHIGNDLYSYIRLSPGDLTGSGVASVADPASTLVILSLRRASAVTATTAELQRTRVFAAAAFLLMLAVGSGLLARQWTSRKLIAETLHRSEARFRSLIDLAPDAVVVADGSGQIVLANSRAETLFGRARQTLVGTPVGTIVPGLTRDGPLAGPMAELRGRPVTLTLEGRRQDGSVVPLAVSVSQVTTDDGALFFCDMRDITAERENDERIRKLNDDLQRRNAELETVNRELESFSYSVSHDLRTPLRAIDGFSQALLEDAADKLDAQSKNYLKRIRVAAQRMGVLIDDLIRLARVSRSELAVEKVDLSALAGQIARGLKEAEPERSGDFAIAPGLVVESDPRLMRVALENLFSNAWKFTSKREKAEIAFGASGVNGERAFFIRDNGAGFDMDHASKLFGPFQRLHDAGSYPGTGIGLATVDRIVRKHGGRIWAEAKPEEGATFYFTLAA